MITEERVKKKKTGAWVLLDISRTLESALGWGAGQARSPTSPGRSSEALPEPGRGRRLWPWCWNGSAAEQSPAHLKHYLIYFTYPRFNTWTLKLVRVKIIIFFFFVIGLGRPSRYQHRVCYLGNGIQSLNTLKWILLSFPPIRIPDTLPLFKKLYPKLNPHKWDLRYIVLCCTFHLPPWNYMTGCCCDDLQQSKDRK